MYTYILGIYVYILLWYSQHVCQVHTQLFLSRAAVLLHLVCFTTKLGFREIQVDVQTSDVMAGAGGAARPAQDVQHQPEGTVCH